MTTILFIIHIIVCVFLVVIVLLQHGKGADIGATFGGSSQSLFGTEGPVPLLNKITTSSAIIFMLTSISLAYLSAHQSTGSVMEGYSQPAPPPALPPAEVPAPTAAPAHAPADIPEAAPTAVSVETQPTVEPAPAEFPGKTGPEAGKGADQAGASKQAPPALTPEKKSKKKR